MTDEEIEALAIERAPRSEDAIIALCRDVRTETERATAEKYEAELRQLKQAQGNDGQWCANVGEHDSIRERLMRAEGILVRADAALEIHERERRGANWHGLRGDIAAFLTSPAPEPKKEPEVMTRDEMVALVKAKRTPRQNDYADYTEDELLAVIVDQLLVPVQRATATKCAELAQEQANHVERLSRGIDWNRDDVVEQCVEIRDAIRARFNLQPPEKPHADS